MRKHKVKSKPRTKKEIHAARVWLGSKPGPGEKNVIRKNLFTWTPAEKMQRDALKLLSDANH